MISVAKGRQACGGNAFQPEKPWVPGWLPSACAEERFAIHHSYGPK